MAAPMSQGSRVPEPGAAPYGNFPNYSRFHPPEGRVSLLPQGLLRSLFPAATRPLLGLDVGCNSGVRGGTRWGQLGRHQFGVLGALGQTGKPWCGEYCEALGTLRQTGSPLVLRALGQTRGHRGTIQPVEKAQDETLVSGGADWEH